MEMLKGIDLSTGMKLEYFPPVVKDGVPVVKLDLADFTVRRHRYSETGPYTFNNRPLMLKHWDEDFQISEESKRNTIEKEGKDIDATIEEGTEVTGTSREQLLSINKYASIRIEGGGTIEEQRRLLTLHDFLFMNIRGAEQALQAKIENLSA
ncbi:hypothetical protein HAX54_036432 [Datura stramonium]|uniref:Uncharacterized protein n=1 Tax=Datura stramonium TaxID=4076 RepID=A0ABS8SG85_DATST|nr:hypothetical protein [Datura stramonium]